MVKRIESRQWTLKPILEEHLQRYSVHINGAFDKRLHFLFVCGLVAVTKMRETVRSRGSTVEIH